MGAGMERVDPLLDSRVSTFGAEAENADVCGGIQIERREIFAKGLRHAVGTPVALKAGGGRDRWKRSRCQRVESSRHPANNSAIIASVTLRSRPSSLLSEDSVCVRTETSVPVPNCT